MKGIHLIATHNVFANVVRELSVFSRALSFHELFLPYSSLNASGGSIVITIPGGPERSAGSLGVVVSKRFSAAYSGLRLNHKVLSILRYVSESWNRIIKDKQCLDKCTLNNDPELGK